MNQFDNLVNEIYSRNISDDILLHEYNWDDLVNDIKVIGLAAAITAAGITLTVPAMKKIANRLITNNPEVAADINFDKEYEAIKVGPPPSIPNPSTRQYATGSQLSQPTPPTAAVDNNTTAVDNNATAHNINFAFIHAREGARRPDFYVPRDDNNRALENSGVTIASGFDIGQHNTNEITTLFAGHDDIILALTPFANVQRQPAVELLNRTRPEDLNSTQIQTIERIVDVDRAAAVVTTFNNNNQLDGNATFNQLPSEFQTVIASVTFQYGNLETETPTFFSQVMNGQWDEVLANLRNFGDSFPSRRNLEGDLWERGLLRLRRQEELQRQRNQ